MPLRSAHYLILALLLNESAAIDEIAAGLGRPIDEVTELLVDLEREGFVRSEAMTDH